MSRVAKYRRQVSEDPDIDNLLSTLSPEEMEELEKELDASDTDGSLPLGLGQKDQTSGKYSREKEPKKSLQKEQTVDEEKPVEKKKEGKILDEKRKDIHSKDVRRNKTFDLGKECKKEENVQKSNQKAKDEPDSIKKTGKVKEKSSKEDKTVLKEKNKTEDRSTTARVKGEEKNTASKNKLAEDKGKEEKAADLKRGIEKDRKREDKKETEKTGDKSSTLKQGSKIESEEKSPRDSKVTSEGESSKPREEKSPRDSKVISEGKSSKPKEEKSLRDSKVISEGKSSKQQQDTKMEVTPDSSSSADSSSNENKEEEATSIFDEPLEKVKNNDPELTEINVNNSDCINNEILVRFAEALEFNTVVKVFALANTHADDHVAFAIAIMLKSNKTLTSINLDSNHITGKGILAIFRALLQNNALTELRFHNQRHICGGKTEMEIAKLLKENTTLLKLGYHFELAGPRMTVTNLLSRNMDKQRQKRLQEQKQAQEKGEKKDFLEVPKTGALPAGSPKASPKPSPKTSPWSSPKPPKKAGAPDAPPPPPPPLAPPLAPPLINESLRNSLSPATQRKMVEKALPPQEKNSRDQLLAAIRSSNLKQLKKVEVPKLLQ
ncbi:leiomodin-1 [Eublepharis macularius]|uniref:Leiomodin-1 n=1 Tax=Eublepharis macularius TaxID=481883 RepID=A0AA97L297_EUBMA|nr:leiomodin-1 [Eublepharis macularius]